MVSVRLAIFDCDGTLVDSQANIIDCMTDTFARHRLGEPDRHAVRRVVGLSLVEAMAALLPEAETALHTRMAEDYKLAFQGRRSNGGLQAEPLFPGVRDGLIQLERSGWLLGVATGKSDRGLAMTLMHHDMHGRFVTLQTADRHPSKPHPSMIQTAMAETGARPENTVMIGDTIYDMEMAVAAHTTPLGVGWGYHEPAELTLAGARHVAADFTELMAQLETRP